MGTKIELPTNEVHAWVESLAADPSRLRTAQQLLSPAELERAGRFVREVDRNRFLIAHLATREILSRYIGIAPADLRFATAEFGKPELLAESNPTNIRFNISHSGEWMLLGVVREARIGVDIEEIRPEAATLDVAARFFTANENRDLRALERNEQVEAFFNCWTRKEAYLKALGCGLSVSPTDCEVTLLKNDEPRIVQRAPGDAAETWTLFHLRSGNYIMAIAVDRPGVQLKQQNG